MEADHLLLDQEWALIAPLIPKAKRRKDGKGRPPRDPREVLDGILWILFSGAPWHMMPKEFPPYQTCHRYFQNWTRTGIIQKMFGALSRHFASKHKTKDPAFVDASFTSAKKGGSSRQNQAGQGF